MPPIIALIICVLFVFFLFWLDHNPDSKVSIALWIPLIWLLIIGSRLLSQWLDPTEITSQGEAYLRGNPLDRTFFLILIIAGIVILSKRNYLIIIGSNKWIIVLFLYSGISILWSDYSFVSLKRFIKEIGNFIMVLIVLTESDPIDAVKKIFRRSSFVLIPLSIILIKYYPEYARTYNHWNGEVEYLGVATSKNMLGMLCLVSGLIFIWNLSNNFKMRLKHEKTSLFVDIILFSQILWLIKKANSATTNGSLVIGISIFIWLSIFKNRVKFVGIFIIMAIFLLTLLQVCFDIIDISVSTLGRDMTFTGRKTLWKDVLNMGTDPIIGTGYDSFWLGERLKILWDKHWWLPNQAHNGYIEIFLNLGFIGLFLFTGFITSAFMKIKRMLLYNYNFARIKMIFFIIALIYSIMEAGFKGMSLMWFVFLIFSIDVPRIESVWDQKKFPIFKQKPEKKTECDQRFNSQPIPAV